MLVDLARNDLSKHADNVTVDLDNRYALSGHMQETEQQLIVEKVMALISWK